PSSRMRVGMLYTIAGGFAFTCQPDWIVSSSVAVALPPAATLTGAALTWTSFSAGGGPPLPPDCACAPAAGHTPTAALANRPVHALVSAPFGGGSSSAEQRRRLRRLVPRLPAREVPADVGRGPAVLERHRRRKRHQPRQSIAR